MPLKERKFSNAGINYEIPQTELGDDFYGVKLTKANPDKFTKEKLLDCLSDR